MNWAVCFLNLISKPHNYSLGQCYFSHFIDPHIKVQNTIQVTTRDKRLAELEIGPRTPVGHPVTQDGSLGPRTVQRPSGPIWRHMEPWDWSPIIAGRGTLEQARRWERAWGVGTVRQDWTRAERAGWGAEKGDLSSGVPAQPVGKSGFLPEGHLEHGEALKQGTGRVRFLFQRPRAGVVTGWIGVVTGRMGVTRAAGLTVQEDGQGLELDEWHTGHRVRRG